MNLIIRCSKLHRAMACAGSLFLEDLYTQEPGDPAKEGTAAGEYLACLLTGKTPGTHASNGVAFDGDMKFFMNDLLQEIVPHAKGPITCEERIDWQTRSGIIIQGQYDVSFESREDTLFIDDLKYGWGLVEVKPNWQLLGYAIGKIIKEGRAYKNIALRIHQPRPHHEDGPTRMWVLTYEELLEYKEKIEQRMEMIANGLKDLTTGPQCKYCEKAVGCAAFNKAFYRGVDLSHTFTQDNISNGELSFQLDLVARVTEILKTKQESLTQLAVSRIKEGQIIPNYLSESRYGDRKWKPGMTADVIKMLTGKDITEVVTLSPAQAEKRGVSKDLVANMTERHFVGSKVVKKDASALGDKIFGKPK